MLLTSKKTTKLAWWAPFGEFCILRVQKGRQVGNQVKMHPLRRLLLRSATQLYFAPTLLETQARCLSASCIRGSGSGESRGQESSGYSALGAGVVASGLCVVWYLRSRTGERHRTQAPAIIKLLPQVEASGGERKDDKPEKVSARERRYKDFSSISFKGEPYMTPRDFLESVTHDSPRRESASHSQYSTFSHVGILMQKLTPSFSTTMMCRSC